MKNRPAYDLKYPMAAHNVFLFIISAAMFLGSLYEIIKGYTQNEKLEVFCSTTESKGQFKFAGNAWFWGYLFYISKFYEYLDTFFIIARKKPLILLHFYVCTKFQII